MGRSRHHKSATLSDYRDWRVVVTVRCHYCRTSRHYLPADMLALFGDIALDALEHRMRCEGCGKREYLGVKTWSPIPADDYPLEIRRLDRIKTVRVPVWRVERIE